MKSNEKAGEHPAAKRKRILVVGGGIAGIALADFLGNDFDVVIVERAPKWRTIGYAIGVWANGLDVLKRIDLTASFWDAFQPVESGSVVGPLGDPIATITKEMVGEEVLAGRIEREVLHQALIEKIPPQTVVHFGTTCTSLEQVAEGVVVTFSDGPRETFDLVVGADGMRSQVREQVFGSHLESYGWHFVLNWIPRNAAFDADYYILNTPGRVVLAIPYRDRISIGFAVPYARGQGPEEVLRSFQNGGPYLDGLVGAFDLHTAYYDRLTYVKMREWYRGRVVLVGDARHGMSPISGFGSSLALGDAYELSLCLREFPRIEDALAAFAERRECSLTSVLRFAHLMESFFTMRSGALVALRDSVMRVASRLGAYVLKRALRSRL